METAGLNGYKHAGTSKDTNHVLLLRRQKPMVATVLQNGCDATCKGRLKTIILAAWQRKPLLLRD
jgi:hypothetical protein